MKKSTKKLAPSLTQIRKYLKAVVWNPRKPGPMTIVSEVGTAEYYECRAVEEIREAQTIRIYDNDPDGYHQHINKAIKLLLLARWNGPNQTEI